MGDSPTGQYLLPDSEKNTEEATVDGITLIKGDPEPKELTEDQAQRLTEAGVKLDRLDKGDDPIDSLKGEALEAELQKQGITVAGSADEKRQALKDRRNRDNNPGS